MPRSRHATVKAAAYLGCLPERLDDVALAISEATANVVRHAYAGRPGELEIEPVGEDDKLCIRVCDHGCGLDRASGGAGLGLGRIIAMVADACEVKGRADGGTEVELAFPRSSSHRARMSRDAFDS